MGDIQLSIFDRRGIIEVEVIRARGLLRKPGSKTLPGSSWLFIVFAFLRMHLIRTGHSAMDRETLQNDPKAV